MPHSVIRYKWNIRGTELSIMCACQPVITCAPGTPRAPRSPFKPRSPRSPWNQDSGNGKAAQQTEQWNRKKHAPYSLLAQMKQIRHTGMPVQVHSERGVSPPPPHTHTLQHIPFTSKFCLHDPGLNLQCIVEIVRKLEPQSSPPPPPRHGHPSYNPSRPNCHAMMSLPSYMIDLQTQSNVRRMPQSFPHKTDTKVVHPWVHNSVVYLSLVVVCAYRNNL